VGLNGDVIVRLNEMHDLDLEVIPLLRPRGDGVHHTDAATTSHRIRHLGWLLHDDVRVHQPQHRFNVAPQPGVEGELDDLYVLLRDRLLREAHGFAGVRSLPVALHPNGLAVFQSPKVSG
jgi:hypothetical protein